HRRAQNRSRRKMLAQDFGGHALGDFAETATVEGKAIFGMGVHIDEARRNHLARGVDNAPGFYRRAADINNLVALDRNVGPHPWPASAIDDLTAFDQDVRFARRLGQNNGGTRKEQQSEDGHKGLVSHHRTGLPYYLGLTVFLS